MSEVSEELLHAVREIRDLVRLMAEPAVAERDKKLRDELRRMVGSSGRKAKAVTLMDGTRTQARIRQESAINQGDLSVLVKNLQTAKLLAGEKKQPKLAIAIPATFFDKGTDE